MHSLITGASPPEPLEPVGPINHPGRANPLPPDYYMIKDWNGNVVEPFWTYGAELTRAVPGVHWILGALLVRCLADQPAHRPSLEELEKFVNIIQGPGANAIPPDDWFNNLYGQPAQVCPSRQGLCAEL